MDIVTLDFETYYAKDFTLSKMTTEEYIRDDRFEVIGVSVKVNDNPTDWFSGDMEATGRFLNSLDYSDKAILCHNTVFDGAILSWHFGIRPKFWFDTLSMARPSHSATVGGSLKNLALAYHLGEKGTAVVDAFGKQRKDFTPAQLANYGEYCINDTEITYKLFKKLKTGFPVSELMVIDQTIRMYTEPVIELNWRKLEQHLSTERERKLTLLNRLGNGDPEVARKKLMSSVRFAALLAKAGATPPTKISPTTGKETFAFAKTDQGMKDLLRHPSPVVRAITEVRLGVKSTIEEKRTERLVDVAKRGTLPILLNYYGAHTGRFSGGDKLNLQNLPSRENNVIRTTLCAPDGHKFIACDSAQIEARLLAYIAGQADLVQAFREGRDVYSEFASLVYGRKIDRKRKEIGADGKEFEPDEKEGFVGKTCILGLGYGMGPTKFRDTLAQAKVFISEDEAKRIVYLYRDRYPHIKRLWDICGRALTSMTTGQNGVIANILPFAPDGIGLPNGMKIRYNLLRATDTGFAYISDARAHRKYVAAKVTGTGKEDVPWTNIYGGKMVENIIQALARIVITDQMLATSAAGHRVVFQVHDENIICVADAEVVAAQQVIERVMSAPPVWAPDLPIACESGVGDNYGECK